jgi:butyryl-CoA dehydrogenase
MLTVCAKTSRERGMKHIALFLVDRQFPGVTLGKQIEKLGTRASATGEILLDDVLVPDGHLLGGETGGAEKVGTILSEIRIMTGALSVGKPIGEHQAIAFKLADMLTRLQAAMLCVYHAAWSLDQALPVTREAAMAKLFASEAANQICDEASRVFASYSFAREYPIERYFRDARFLLWGGGTSEMLRLVIGRDLDRAPSLGSA